MATSTTEYPVGTNNIIYKAKSFGTGKTVTCFIWNPELEKSDEITLDEIGNGLYSFTYIFTGQGIYPAIFLEDGVEQEFHSFRTNTNYRTI